MFDIGLMEIMIVLIIALLVIGPERMPEVARKLGAFMGKTKRFINSMKEDSEISATVKDIQSSMNFEDERKHLEEMRQDLNNDFSQSSQDLNLDELQSPFGNSAETAGNQFNKAPSQPNAPKPTEEPPQANSSEPALAESAEPQTTPEKTTALDTSHSDQAAPSAASVKKDNQPA